MIDLKPLVTLTSVLRIESERDLGYLKQYFKVIPALVLFDRKEMDALTNEEKIYHDMIKIPKQYNTNSLNAWTCYITWIGKNFKIKSNDSRKETIDPLRVFITLENFTKSSVGLKEFYDLRDFIYFWVQYIDMCADGLDMFNYMKKHEICTKNYFLYESMGILTERHHDFMSANVIYLEGLAKRLDKHEILKMKYKEFEARMENRINREIKSCGGQELLALNKHVQSELIRASRAMTNTNKRHRTSNSFSNISLSKGRLEIFDDYSDNIETLTNAQYGEVPVYVDAPYREDLITKGTKLVDVYRLINDYLNKNDPKYEMLTQAFDDALREEMSRKPNSWLKSRMFLKEELNLPIEIANAIDSSPKIEISNFNKVYSPKKEIANAIDSPPKMEIANVIKVPSPKKEIANANKVPSPKKEIAIPNKVPSPKYEELAQNLGVKGEKVKYVSVSIKNEKKIIISRIPQLMEKRINHFYQAQSKLKKKRDTLIIKVDEDGDLLMSSDEEENEEQPVPIKIQNKFPPQERTLTTNELKTLNLFDKPMSIDEINEKISEVTRNFHNKKISQETCNLLYKHLEDKISEIEKGKPLALTKHFFQSPTNKTVSRSLDFSNANYFDKENFKHLPMRDSSDSQGSNLAQFLNPTHDKLEDIFQIKATPKKMIPTKEKATVPNYDLNKIFNLFDGDYETQDKKKQKKLEEDRTAPTEQQDDLSLSFGNFF